MILVQHDIFKTIVAHHHPVACLQMNPHHGCIEGEKVKKGGLLAWEQH